MTPKVSVLFRSAAKEFARRVVLALGDDVDTIVLYGSAARGGAGTHSDIDILIVSPDPGVTGRVLSEICSELMYEHGYTFFISMVHLGRQEFHRLVQLGSPFLQEVLSEGVVLHDNGTFSTIRQGLPAGL